MEERVIRVRVEPVGGYEFRARFPGDWPAFMMDEPGPLGRDSGPNAAMVLAAAVGNCLAASLTLCLGKSHAQTTGVGADVVLSMARNEKGRFRIARIEVTLDPGLAAEDAAKLDRCKGIFEDFCIVTQSVRQGIEVDVRVLPAGVERAVA